MSLNVVNGLPAHILLNHFIIVLAPLTAVLAIVAAVWPAARRRLVWLISALSAVTLALTPPTVTAGAWLADRVGPSPAADTHMTLGDTTLYCSAALVIAAVLLVVIHLRERRAVPLAGVARALVAVVVIVTATGVCVQIYRIGESGARAAWGELGGSTASAD